MYDVACWLMSLQIGIQLPIPNFNTSRKLPSFQLCAMIQEYFPNIHTMLN